MATAKYKTPTIDDLTSEDRGPIYVVNTSAKVNQTGADVFVTVYVGNQSAATILSIPLSWKPFNLTEQAPRQAILGSQHFLRSVSSGVLTLISKEEAQDILATPQAIKETERLSQLRSKVEAAIRNPNADEFKLTIEGQEEAEGKKHTVSASFFDEGSVSTSFKAWVAKNNQLDVEDAINAARIRSEFSADEMQYIMDNTVHPRIRNGFKKRLQIMSSSAE
jgi:hypothetical protein